MNWDDFGIGFSFGLITMAGLTMLLIEIFGR